jgi:3-oxoacyl-[acyl-carrier-protein] synthase II
MARMKQTRIVITGIGLTAPNGNSLAEFRANLLNGVSGITTVDVRFMGRHPAGMCTFNPLKYQKKKDVRIGTRVRRHQHLLRPGGAGGRRREP